jgi:tRNA-Thr(GGU) m(6)t(6)A37 methyltransferase TsaA
MSNNMVGVTHDPYQLRPIGTVESPLLDRNAAPLQGDEGAPEAWLVFDEEVREGLGDLQRDNEIVVLTWLHQARRDVLRVHPRGNPANPRQGVFSTRSPDRPNPIGLHRVTIVAIEGTRIRVRNLEAINDTPIIDIKPSLDPSDR